MNSTPINLQAGRPRLSAPLHRIARPLGPLAVPLAGTRLFPLWGILRHRGRKSGTAYATPIVAMPIADGFIIPLPFGDATQWAKNLFAAGRGELRAGGKEHHIIDPRLLEGEEAHPFLSSWVRFSSKRLGLRHFVLVRTAPEPEA